MGRSRSHRKTTNKTLKPEPPDPQQLAADLHRRGLISTRQAYGDLSNWRTLTDGQQYQLRKQRERSR